MPDNWRIKQVLREMGGLLPFLANHEGDQARRLVAANQEGTALFVDSQGEVDTPASLFGDPPNSEEMQAPPEGRVEEGKPPRSSTPP